VLESPVCAQNRREKPNRVRVSERAKRGQGPVPQAIDQDTTPTSPPQSMAAATQTARTSSPSSKMSSPKDSKTSLPTVTKTEGVYAPVAAAP